MFLNLCKIGLIIKHIFAYVLNTEHQNQLLPHRGRDTLSRKIKCLYNVSINDTVVSKKYGLYGQVDLVYNIVLTVN